MGRMKRGENSNKLIRVAAINCSIDYTQLNNPWDGILLKPGTLSEDRAAQETLKWVDRNTSVE